MSTFNGIIEEFPRIRIDYFRKNPDRPSPLACFLSHVHSDHLSGLESLRAPFVYCSAATKEILLRIEKYPHRMNFTKGILETRKQHYKHLANLLRPIPLQVPTEIELTPRSRLRVTLFDANHCIGAVMFLIEGDGKAVLYTGDIRAETWWVDSLVRNPVLIPYTLGSKRLDKIYLDTTFATTSNIYRTFPSKAEGVRELLRKVERYPEDTVFYFRSWTFGYEEVWLALSACLNAPIHVDRYQIGLYKALAINYGGGFGVHEAPYLNGFRLGNSRVPGCLTSNQESKLHSCEPGTFCSVIASRPSIFICPIVNRAKDGSKVPEHGAGGGGGDLYQSHELELPNEFTLQQLEILCREHIKDETVLSKTIDAISSAFNSESKTLSLDTYGLKPEDEISLKELVLKLSRGNSDGAKSFDDPPSTIPSTERGEEQVELPTSIEFPYSRHSSYDELLNLIEAFRPKDVFPCTVDEATWRDEVSMQTLFGHLCSGNEFTHDRQMRETVMDRDQEWQRERPTHTPEPDSILRTDETESRDQESTNQSFASVTSATSSHLAKRGEQRCPPTTAKPPIPDRDDIQAVNSSEQQNPTARGVKRTHEMLSSSPLSSFSPPHAGKIQVLKQAMRTRPAQSSLDKREESISPIPQLSQLTDDASLSFSSLPASHAGKIQTLKQALMARPTRESPDDELTTRYEASPPPVPLSQDAHANEPENQGSTTTKVDRDDPAIVEFPDHENMATQSDTQVHVYYDHNIESQIKIESQDTILSYSALGSQQDSQALEGAGTSPRSFRNRAEAYRAARSGTFSDWAELAPVSSGNNHAEEEVDI